MAERTQEKPDPIKTETLVRKLGANIARGLNEGQTNLSGQIARYDALVRQLQRETAEAAPEDLPEIGLDERHRVKRPYRKGPRYFESRRENAQHSTGPASEEGKRRSAQNGATANFKHGRYAKSALVRTFGVCTGPNGCSDYPCLSVEDGSTDKDGLCLDPRGLPGKIAALTEAAKSGRTEDVNALAAIQLASGMEIVERMAADIMDDGPLVKEDLVDKNGVRIQDAYHIKAHPLLKPMFEGLKTLGISLPELRMTPRELKRGEDADKDRASMGGAYGAMQRALQRGATTPPGLASMLLESGPEMDSEADPGPSDD